MTTPASDPREPDNPAAYALARHIADHPISTIYAAFRYLNAPLTVEFHEDPAAPEVQPPADRATEWREAARFLRRTPRDSPDLAGALRGARLIEDELRRQQCPEREPLIGVQCSKQSGHEGAHSDRPGQIWEPAPDDETNDVCDAEPPSDGQWGDCWCTLRPGHDGDHRCQPCTDRHGAPGWADEQDGVQR